MNGWLGMFELAALVVLAAVLAAAAAAALLYPLCRGRIQRLAPEPRARLLGGVAAAPLALAAGLLVLCLTPSVLGAAGLHRDHCPRHAEHLHLCLIHRPRALAPAWAGASLLGALPLLGALGIAAVGAQRSRRLRGVLELGGAGELGHDVRLVASSLPLSVTAGLLRPRIYVSDELAGALGRERLAVVLEHERAHLRRRDGLRRLAAAALCWMLPPPVRGRLLADLSLACEQACDAAAARSLGDRLRVAETILAAERLLGRREEPRAVCAFGDSSVPERVAHLLGEEPPRAAAGRPGWLPLAVVAAVGAAIGLADRVHHLTEHLLAHFVR